MLLPDDESEPASEGNSNSEREDPQPVVNYDLVCDAPVVLQPPEAPIPQPGAGNGEIAEPVRLGTGSSRASPAVMRSRSANNARGPVAVQNENCE